MENIDRPSPLYFCGPNFMYKISHECYDSFTPSNMKFHDCYEIYIHIKGADKYYISPQAIDLQPMDIFIIPPHQIHGMISEHDIADYECVHFYLTEETIRRLGYDILPIDKVIKKIGKSSLQRIRLSPEKWTKMRTLIPLFESDYNSLHDEERVITMGAMSIFLGEICKAARSSEIIPANPTFPSIMHSVCTYITEHFTDSCTLEELAEHFSMNKHHLSRSFTKTFNISIYQYVLICRISYAKTLIAQGESFTDAAIQCGFRDYSNFLRVFNTHTGMSPSKWKKLNCGSDEQLPFAE